MTFDNEFLLVHYPKRGSDFLYKKRIVTVNGAINKLQEVVSPYYANKVANAAYNFRTDWISINCGKYGRVEIYRK